MASPNSGTAGAIRSSRSPRPASASSPRTRGAPTSATSRMGSPATDSTPRPKLPASPRVRVPTLLLWGAKDRFLGRELAQPSIDLCDGGRLEFVEEASHWIQHEEPERVNRELVELLG